MYIDIQLVPVLNWKFQTQITSTKTIDQCKLLTNCSATSNKKFSMVDTVNRACIAYIFYAVPYSLPAIKNLDKNIIKIQNVIYGVQNCTAYVITQLPHDLLG